MRFGKQIATVTPPAQLIWGEAAAAPRWLRASVHRGVVGFIWKKQCFALHPKANGCRESHRLPGLPAGHPPRTSHTMYDYKTHQAWCRQG